MILCYASKTTRALVSPSSTYGSIVGIRSSTSLFKVAMGSPLQLAMPSISPNFWQRFTGFGRPFLTWHVHLPIPLSWLLNPIDVSRDSGCLLGQSERIPNTFKAFGCPCESFASLLAILSTSMTSFEILSILCTLPSRRSPPPPARTRTARHPLASMVLFADPAAGLRVGLSTHLRTQRSRPI